MPLTRVVRSSVLPYSIDEVWTVLRDFNSHAVWHPAIRQSEIEGALESDRIGCVRTFSLSGGERVREQLLSLDDKAHTLRYCIVGGDLPLERYVAQIELKEVTDGDACFWRWSSSFEAPSGQRDAFSQMVGCDVYEAGFLGLRRHLDARSGRTQTIPSPIAPSAPNAERFSQDAASAFISVLQSRTSVQHFDPSHTVSREEIAELTLLASYSPTSFNMQNWRLIAYTSSASKERLKACAFGQQKVADAAVTFVIVGVIGGHRSLQQTLEPAVKAGLVEAASLQATIEMANGIYEGRVQFQRDEAIRSGSLAAMALMLSAQAKGWGSCALIGIDSEAVARECELAEHEVPVMLLAVGRRAPGNRPRKYRKPLHEFISYRDG
jgi:nitroreductase